MFRRLLIWVLSAALATAPLAPAWAMARSAMHVVDADSAAMHHGQRSGAYHPSPTHSANAAHSIAHTPVATHADSRTGAAHVLASTQPFAAGHSAADCANGRCDGQCCGVCILTLGSLTSYRPTVISGAADSPAYRVRTYTSFIPLLPERPPQA